MGRFLSLPAVAHCVERCSFLEYGAILNNTAYWDKAMAEYTWTAYTIPSAKKNVTKTGLWSSTHGVFHQRFNATEPPMLHILFLVDVPSILFSILRTMCPST